MQIGTNNLMAIHYLSCIVNYERAIFSYFCLSRCVNDFLKFRLVIGPIEFKELDLKGV